MKNQKRQPPPPTIMSKKKEGFSRGSIVRIKLDNFMTYSHLDFFPGPFMNVIIGPNGSGKSTIMCAICLGLGGKPSLIGRAGNIGEYVKHGQQKAHIHVELFVSDREKCVICREITRSGQSSFTIDGQAVKIKQVEDKVYEFSIQLANLCQFLPQDRVVEFVKMTPQQLLENTEKAAGPVGMFEDHCRLRNWHSKTKELETTGERLQNDLEAELQRKTRLEEQVQNYRERQGIVDKIGLLKKKRYWMLYNLARQEYMELKEQRSAMERENEESQAQMQPMVARTNELQRLMGNMETRLLQSQDGVRRDASATAETLKRINGMNDQATEVVHGFDEILKEEETRTVRLQELKLQVLSLENELQNLQMDEEGIATELSEISRDMQQLSTRQERFPEELDRLRRDERGFVQELDEHRRRLQQMQDVEQQRLDILRQADNHAYKAAIWLRQNKGRFRKTIHGPVMTTINVRVAAWAKYVESHVPFKDLVAFVCEDADDLELFVTTLRDQQKLRINVVMAPIEAAEDFQPDHPITDYGRFGFHCYLRETMDAPAAVLSYLCRQYRIYSLPVGNSETKRCVESVLQSTPFKVFYAENHKYTVRVSRYGRRVKSTISKELWQPRLLVVNLDVQTVELAERESRRCNEQLEGIRRRTAEAKEEDQRLRSAIEALRKRKKELVGRRDFKKNLSGRVEQKKDAVRQCEGLTVNVDEERAKAQAKLVQITVAKIAALQKHNDAIKKWTEAAKRRVRLTLEHGGYSKEKLALDAGASDRRERLNELRLQLNALQARASKAQDDAKRRLAKAKDKTGEMSQSDLYDMVEKSFPDLPDTLDDLEQVIVKLEAQVECLINCDESVLWEYHQFEARLERLEAAVRDNSLKLVQQQEEMEDVHKRWLPPLRNLVKHINTKFAHYFASLQCAGEVGLSAGANDKDYGNYGISIKVKYRAADPLRELTAHYQSGGERSVATILYLLALQEFIKLPFCCVDEINQGMDSTNERRVFSMMTQTVCDENQCQYFMVTPKLLPDLEYGRNITIHCIYNGNVSIHQSQWNIATFLKNRAELPEDLP